MIIYGSFLEVIISLVYLFITFTSAQILSVTTNCIFTSRNIQYNLVSKKYDCDDLVS